MKIRSLVGAGLGLVVALSLAVSPAGADGGFDSSTPSGGFGAPPAASTDADAPVEQSAEEALAAVESIFTPTSANARARAVPRAAAPDATMALRDLWMKRGELTGDDADRADALLARPVPGQVSNGLDPRAIDGAIASQCASGVCVHYTSQIGATYNDAASPANVAATSATVQSVRTRLIAAGFKTPLPDSAAQHGGTTDLDVYMMDLKPYGIYGYCAPTDGFAPGVYTTSAYCVVDNDFVGYSTSPAAALQVTVAHEYFHAVQGAYDWAEDRWFAEGSAAWVEDELYDNINDNRQYLRGSQMKAPWIPLDYFNDDLDGGFNRYGSWIFLRYLSEKAARTGIAPLTFMRRVWERADSSPGMADNWSMQAVQAQINALPKAFPGGFARTYSQFAAANRLPSKFYSEGSAYPKAPAVNAKFTKRTRALKTNAALDRLDHLSSYTARLVPHKSYGKKVRLKVSLNLPGKTANPGATVRIFHKNGKITTSWVSLNSKGDATKRVAFTRKKVKSIEVTVSNGSTSYACWQNNQRSSCEGNSKHDNLRHKLTLTVLR